MQNLNFLPLEWRALSPRWRLTTLCLALTALVVMLPHFLPDSFTSADSLRFSNLKDHIKGIKYSAEQKLFSVESSSRTNKPIPNIVHFVHLLKLDTNQTFDFPFRQFISIYSAHHYLQPEHIYIHTNVPEHQIEARIRNSSSAYTHAVSKLPSVKFNYHAAPNRTSNNLTVDLLPNQSDFVRTDVLFKYGGIYLDDDAYILRDVESFRHMGFENVIGQQLGGSICPAVIMATKGSKMMKVYHALQDTVFDGSWANHAVDLLNTLAREFVSHPYQVLINPRETFFTYSWLPPDLETIYKINSSQPVVPKMNNPAIDNATDFIEHFRLRQPKTPQETWQVDWRPSYVLHGWNHGVDDMMQDYKKQGKADQIFGLFGGITLDYVLEQNSNFARAVYPAVKHALDHGVLDELKFSQSRS